MCKLENNQKSLKEGVTEIIEDAIEIIENEGEVEKNKNKFFNDIKVLDENMQLLLMKSMINAVSTYNLY